MNKKVTTVICGWFCDSCLAVLAILWTTNLKGGGSQLEDANKKAELFLKVLAAL
ncbi:hypothetical protein AWB81_08157 [Caballeronia arationis]|jgi:hypothetical protein|uniref:Uncharacterized protein n=1 Tax=Caballeronia arationis TaxID=1777142 RepID=A0A7Z7I1G1_9BURK|nr:hypothetical protein AWB81_08157 [Caballeronia arationis]SOE50704.1 hypothetical protein SAMN05446927_0438 [Caballeronia arationis]